jgi:MFS family permease
MCRRAVFACNAQGVQVAGRDLNNGLSTRGRHEEAFLRGLPAGAAFLHGASSLAEAAAEDPARADGLDLGDASGTWVMMVAVSTLMAGIACPILGAIADKYAARKAVTYITGALSIVFLTIFAFSSGHSPWQELLAVIGLGMMFTSIMHCFYNSLLMMVSGRHDMIKVACLQCMVGAWGAAILMIGLGMANINGQEDLDRTYIITCFCVSAVWFVILSLPLWFWLEEKSSIGDYTLSETLAASWQDTLKSLQVLALPVRAARRMAQIAVPHVVLSTALSRGRLGTRGTVSGSDSRWFRAASPCPLR